MTTTPRSRGPKTAATDDSTEVETAEAVETVDLGPQGAAGDTPDAAPADTPAAVEEKAPPFPDVYPGSVGPLVEQVQAAVGIEPTGTYDKATKAAVIAAQKGAGFRPTGTFTDREASALAAVGELLRSDDTATESSSS